MMIRYGAVAIRMRPAEGRVLSSAAGPDGALPPRAVAAPATASVTDLLAEKRGVPVTVAWLAPAGTSSDSRADSSASAEPIVSAGCQSCSMPMTAATVTTAAITSVRAKAM